MSQAVPVPFFVASLAGAGWAWIGWLLIGMLVGGVANRLVLANRLQATGNRVIGAFGGFLGGLGLAASGLDVRNTLWSFLTALIGASVLLSIIHVGGRGRRLGGTSGV